MSNVKYPVKASTEFYFIIRPSLDRPGDESCDRACLYLRMPGEQHDFWVYNGMRSGRDIGELQAQMDEIINIVYMKPNRDGERVLDKEKIAGRTYK